MYSGKCNFITIIALLLVLASCNLPRKAYLYYKVDRMDFFLAEIVLETRPHGDIYRHYNIADTLCSDSLLEILLKPRVTYYYKEKRKDYSRWQRGMLGSEEKIDTIRFYLISEMSDTIKDFSFGQVALDKVDFVNFGPSSGLINYTYSHEGNRDLDLLNIEDFIGKFNQPTTPFIYDHHMNKTLRLRFSILEKVKPGDYTLECHVHFKNGRTVKGVRQIHFY